MRRARLDGPIDLAGFRREAKRLLALGAQPEEVVWDCGDATDGDLWSLAETEPAENDPTSPAGTGRASFADARSAERPPPPLHVPKDFLRLCEDVLLHREPQRFALMYRLLARLAREPAFWRDPLDPDRRRAEQLAREVRHEIHKLHAFVRFVPVVDEDLGGKERLVAWIEPEHHVLEAAAPFFARRFANERWAILSPRCSVTWDGVSLALGPGGTREQAPAPDAGARLWLTYYRSIFNPARLKVAMMEREMPRRYWANLPEAALIEPLVAQAQARMDGMLEAEPTAPRRLRPIAPIDRSPQAAGAADEPDASKAPTAPSS